jgi:hypothetical protein
LAFTTIAGSFLGRLLSDFTKGASVALRKEIQEFNTPAKIRKMGNQIARYEKVRTIKDDTKTSKLSDFYIAPHFSEDSGKPFIANEVDDFGNGDHILIEGIAGQGKSIFMRHLFVNEIRKGRRMPILIELRTLDSKRTLLDHIHATLRNIGFDFIEDIWRYLAEAGFAVLLLDGLDEVPEEIRSSLLSEINSLPITYENIRVILTSRPEPIYYGLTSFKVVRMCRINGTDRAAIIRKICNSHEAESLIESIASYSDLSEIVDTPLFTTLLCVVFISEQTIPSTIHEFYETTFYTLLHRHDDRKGLIRKRKSGLGNYSFAKVFEMFCFLASAHDKTSLSQNESLEFIDKAIRQAGLKDVNSDDFFKDVVSVTCLLVKDGTRYEFLHKSIQEYFSAKYIKNEEDPRAVEFYEKTRSSFTKTRQFIQQLGYLKEIDTYRFSKYYAIPGLLDELSGSGLDIDELTKLSWTPPFIQELLARFSILAILNRDPDAIIPIAACAMNFNNSKPAVTHFFRLEIALIDGFREVFLDLWRASPQIASRLKSTVEARSEADEIWNTGDDSLCFLHIDEVINQLAIADTVAQVVNESDGMRQFRLQIETLLEEIKRREGDSIIDFV